jgi:hypothetical protein
LAGWSKDLIVEFWQTDMPQLNGYKPIEALAAGKPELAQMASDYYRRRFDKRVEACPKLKIVEDKSDD